MIVYGQVAQTGKLCYPDNRNQFTAHLVLYKVCFANPAFPPKVQSKRKKKGEMPLREFYWTQKGVFCIQDIKRNKEMVDKSERLFYSD